MRSTMIWLGKLIRAVLYLIVILLLFYVVARFYVVYSDSQIEGARAPYLQKQSSTSITVMWNTEKAEIGVVRYGFTPNGLDLIAKDKHPTYQHEIRITDLEPGTRYYYSVGKIRTVEYGGSEKYWFTTAKETGSTEPVRLWVIGDSGYPGEVSAAVRDGMKNWVNTNQRPGLPGLDQWILLGDNAYRSGSNEQYQAALFDSYPLLLRNFAFWPVYGNHDAKRWTFFDIFSLPTKAEAGGVKSGTEHYYSFNYGNIHYIVLDSEESGRDQGDRMLRWLKKDLKATEQSWIIVAFHHPPYSKGAHDSDDSSDSEGSMVEMRENVVPILEKYGVDLVLSGHNHVYERSKFIACHYGDSDEFSDANVVSAGVAEQNRHFIKARENGDGTLYVVAGASSRVKDASLDHPAMAVSMAEAGSLIIDIEDNILIGRYINTQSEVLDEFIIEKQDGYSSGYKYCP